jgi:hypothetical protein
LQFSLGAFYGSKGPQKYRILINPIAHHWINGKKKPAISSGFCTSLDFVGLRSGGGGGSRTRVRKYSTAASTYIAFVLVSRLKSPKGKIPQALSCSDFTFLTPGR